MSGIVERARRNVDSDCHSTRCRKRNCSVKLDGIPQNRVIIDLDCDRLPWLSDLTRCDYLLLAESGSIWIAPIELKGGRFDIGHAVGQLQGGVDALLEILAPKSLRRPAASQGAAEDRQSRIASGQLFPVIAHAKGIRKADKHRLRRHEIKMGHKRAKAITIKCGESLGKALGRRSKAACP